MDNDILYVFKALSEVELGKVINPTQVVIRCPICGEPGKVRTHGHCYVGLVDGHPPMVYHCFINECSGIVTPAFLRDVGIYDLELDNILNLFNKAKGLDKKTKKIMLRKKIRENVNIPDIPYNILSKNKLAYLRDRLGIDFSVEDCKKFKIIFSLKQFLADNKLNENIKYRKFINLIDRDYIGFLTKENDYIIFRDITGKNKLRYIKYDLLGTIDSKIIYTLPTACDIFNEKVILNVAEGTFDILGIYYNIMNKKEDNVIYSACCGSGYSNTIKYFIKLGFVGNLVVNIFSDKDKRPYYYKKLYNELKPWVKEINIYYNSLDKDYGIPKEKIRIEKVNSQAILG